jgi:hypothetical protein
MAATTILPAFFLLPFLAGEPFGQQKDAAPPERLYKIDQKMCDQIQDDMTEARVREIIGGPPHAESCTVFAAPFSGKAMPVTIEQWWGKRTLIEVHFDDKSKTVCFKRILEGVGRRLNPPGGEVDRRAFDRRTQTLKGESPSSTSTRRR